MTILTLFWEEDLRCSLLWGGGNPLVRHHYFPLFQAFMGTEENIRRVGWGGVRVFPGGDGGQGRAFYAASGEMVAGWGGGRTKV